VVIDLFKSFYVNCATFQISGNSTLTMVNSTLILINTTINTSAVWIEDGSSIWKDINSKIQISLWISLIRRLVGSLGIILV